MDKEEWVDFPSPADLWPDNYDYERFGFGLPPMKKAPLYQQAFKITILKLEEPADFSLLLPSSNQLIMIYENDEKTGVIQNLYN